MPDFIPPIAFDPLIAWPLIALIGGAALMAALFAGAGRLRSMFLRTLAAIAVITALANPQTVEEDRTPLRDIALILTDSSESTALGGRREDISKLLAELQNNLSGDTELEIITADISPDTSGTRLTAALIETLSNIPSARLAGVIAITDGQIHDLPESPETLLPDGVPFHALIVGNPEQRDRRIRAVLAPRYGLVNEQAEFQVQVDDPGHEGERARIEIKLNGVVQARFPAVIGNTVSIPLEIERRGVNTVELTVESAPDELTLKNNVFISEISGIRDRMRVLLVTGNPHRGARAWRNLLKSDPAVDLVQFTILRTQSKNPRAGQNELSLIAFPTRQLFEEKLDEFDLIIFDQYVRRTGLDRGRRLRPILLPIYLLNIANYVENGGALLVAAGPAFATDNSLYRSPLAAVLPARPTGETTEQSYRPSLNDKGRRHPITSIFQDTSEPTWGPWHRVIESTVVSGDTLMEAPGEDPLLVIDRVGEGRVGMLMSDQAWLWAKGYQGGGPYSEMFRRLAHWLLGEPDLDAEKLIARAEGNDIQIERRTLGESAAPVEVVKPDGTRETVRLKKAASGTFTGTASGAGQGAYRLSSDGITTITAIGALNPREFADLTPTAETLAPLTSGTGGIGYLTHAEALPDIRRIKPGAKAASALDAKPWMGLNANKRYTLNASRRTPLAPGWLYFLLAAIAMGWAWRREGQ